MTTMAETKTCGECGLVGPLEDFAWADKKRGYRRNLCHSCSRAKTRAWRKANPEKQAAASARWANKNPERRRGHFVRAKLNVYGITVEQYDEMLARQGGVCAVCKQPETMTRKGTLRMLTVDHDHATGRVRGLLCSKCNVGIAMFDDDAARMTAAGEYVARARQESEEMYEVEVQGVR